MISDKSNTVRNIFYTFTAATCSKLIGAFTAVILPKLLDPSNYGTWVTLLLIMSYAPIANLGAVEALVKQYPYYVGKGEDKKAKQYEETVLGSTCITAAFLSICSLLIPFVIARTVLDAYRQEVMMMFMTAAVSSISTFFYFRCTAHQNFKATSIIDSLRAMVTAVLILTLVWLWSLKGAVIAFLAAEVIVCIFSALLSARLCGKVKIRFDRKEIWQAVKIGFPITIVIWALVLQSSVDRMVSASLLGKEMTGYYGLGISIVSMLVLIPGAINRVLYPKINEGIGKNKTAKQLSALVFFPARALSMSIPVFIGVLILLLPTIYRVIFPKYLQGIQSTQLLLLGFFFAGLIGSGANYLIAKSKQNILLGLVVISMITNAVCAICFISFGLSIVGVALSTDIAMVLLVTLIWILVLKYMNYSAADHWRTLIGLYSPFILMLSLLFIYQCILPMYLNSTGLTAVIYVLIFAFSYLTILFFVPPYSKWCREIYHFVGKHFHSSVHDAF